MQASRTENRSPLPRRAVLGTLCALAALLASAAVAWACVPQGTLSINPSSGQPGSTVTATVGGFPPGAVEIRWNGLEGQLLASGNGPTISFTIPANAPPGVHTIIAATTGEHASHSAARASFGIAQPVRLEDNAFVTPAVAVTPGQSVTWNYPASTETHNVHFEDDSFTDPLVPTAGPWTKSRTFDTEGTYRFFCQNHGRAGGQGMAGIVYVNATGTVPGLPPAGSFTVSPGTARAGQNVTLDASGTMDPDSTIARHEWDLDGNGSFETDTGTMPTLSETFTTAGQRFLKLRVTDSQGHTSLATRPLTVNMPVVSFSAQPAPAKVGQAVSFTASASSNPGTIEKYEWDLDGNGSYETDTGATPSASRSYANPGSVNVKLRATDDLDMSSEATRSVQVVAASRPVARQPDPPAQGGTTPTTDPRPVGCSALKGAKRAVCMQKACSAGKKSKRAACIRKSCRYVKRSKRSACMRKSCRTLKGAKKRACVKKYTRKS